MTNLCCIKSCRTDVDVKLVCDRCKLMFCSKHNEEANDQGFDFSVLVYDGLWHVPECDVCEYCEGYADCNAEGCIKH